MTVTGTWDSNYQVVYDFGTLPVEYQAEYTLPGAASYVVGDIFVIADNLSRITSYNVCYTKLLRCSDHLPRHECL